jgi:hypothetical protein
LRRAVIFILVACSSPSGNDGGSPHDSGVPDSGTPDSGTPDAGSADAGTPDAGEPGGCSCGDAGVCGTGLLGDPVRCCDYSQDDCLRDAGACEVPTRCSPRPDCCRTGFCPPDVSCGGTNICLNWLGGAAAPDGTPCDDGRACSTAVPPPALPDCVGLDGTDAGDDCTRDFLAAFPFGTACPGATPWCSGRTSSFAGNGGPISGGRCCPIGMACDLNPSSPTWGKCLGNAGWGATSNDVCRAGVCSADSTAACP